MNQDKPNQKLLMLGLDAALPDLISKFTEEGSMPVTKQLIERGITVWVNNHRSVQGILEMMVQLGALVGKRKEAMALVHQMLQ